jgi:hypothetical protein
MHTPDIDTVSVLVKWYSDLNIQVCEYNYYVNYHKIEFDAETAKNVDGTCVYCF